MTTSWLGLEQFTEMKAIEIIRKTLAKSIFVIFIFLFVSSSFSESSFFEEITQDAILPVDEAFIFSAHKINGNSIILTWDMKENCFLYKDKFNIKTQDSKLKTQSTLGEPIRIDDVYFGDVEVYFNHVSKEIIWDEKTENLTVSYQGCNEKGFCYPVVDKLIDVKELHK